MKQFLITYQFLMSYRVFCPVHPQNNAAAYKSTQLWSRFGSSVMEYPQTCVSVIQPLLFLYCLSGYMGQGLGELAPLAILSCTV